MPETAEVGGRSSEGLWYELALLADGMEPGTAKGLALLKQLDDAADGLQKKLNTLKVDLKGTGQTQNRSAVAETTGELATLETQAGKTRVAVERLAPTPAQLAKYAADRDAHEAKTAAIIALQQAFTSGSISGDEYAKRAGEIGLKLRTVSDAAKETAAALPAVGTAAVTASTGIATATRSVSLFTTIIGSLAAGAVLNVLLQAGFTLIRRGLDSVGAGASDAAKKIDDMIAKLIAARDEARRAGLTGVGEAEILVAGRIAIAEGELTRLRAGTRVFDPSTQGFTKTIVDQSAVTKAQEKLNQLIREGRELRLESERLETEGAQRRAVLLGRALEDGNKNNEIQREANSLLVTSRLRLTELLASGRGDEGTVAEINKLQGMIDALTAAEKKASKTADQAEAAARRLADAQSSARLAFESATAAQSPGKVDDFEATVEKLTAQAVKAKLGADEIRRLVGDLRNANAGRVAEDLKDLERQTRDIGAAATVTAVDDLTHALADLIAEMERKGAQPELLKKVREIQQVTIDATKAAEGLETELARINQDVSQGFNLTGALRDLDGLIEKAASARDATPEKSRDRADAQTRLNALIAKELEIRKQLKAITDGTNAQTQNLAQQTANIAGGIANAANAAFGLASAFLGVDDNITKSLGSIGQLAGGISQLAGLADKAGGLGKLFSTGTGLASALPALGAALGGAITLASLLLGGSAEERARLERLRENTAAIQKLTDRVGDLGQINATGTDIEDAKEAIAKALAADQSTVEGRFQVSRSFAQLREIAEQFGITFGKNPSIAEIKALLEAINESELGVFAETFAGQVAKLDRELSVFNITDPIKQVQAFRKAIEAIGGGGQGGVLGDLIDAFDLSNPEGIASAIAALQKLFSDVTSGAIDTTQFGGLSGTDILDSIDRLLGILTGRQTSTGTGGFNVSQQITEVTGARMSALLSTANIFAQQTAEHTSLIARLLGGTQVPLLGPPAVPVGTGFGGAGITFTGDLVFQITGPVTDPEGTATRIAEGFVKQIDSQLGVKTLWARRSVGDVTRN